MRKWWLIVLLLLNLALLGHWRGWFDLGIEDVRQPERRAKQINPLELVTKAEQQARAPNQDQKRPTPSLLCLQFPALESSDANVIRTAVQALVTPLKVEEQKQENFTSYLVFLPPAESLRAAQRRVPDLVRLGVEETFIFPDGELKWAISLGLFRSREGAEKFTKALAERNILGARIQPRVIANLSVISVNGLNANQAAAVAALAQRGPNWASAPCKP